jgi:nicotinamide riboside kinase
MPEALRIAIVGAESTGKTALALALEQRLGDEFGLSCARVAEYLREWCDTHGRTPRPQEQLGIATEQQRRIDAAAASGVDVVLCDTTPLMIAVYSELLFGDRSFADFARAGHARSDFTLLTALDLPWVADGLQRDGPHVREPVDRLVREQLAACGCSWGVIAGTGDARAGQAIDALRPVLARWARRPGTPGRLFSALLATGVGAPRPQSLCELCDDPACEHRARRLERR